MRQLAATLVQNLPAKAFTDEINTLFEFVRRNIRYLQDVHNVETVQWPAATLKLGHGDCDDMAVLLSTLLQAIGFKTRFVAIGFDPPFYDHVYVEVLHPDSQDWIAADPTELESLGWSATGYACRIDFPVD